MLKALFGSVMLCTVNISGQDDGALQGTDGIRIIELQGTVSVLPNGATNWVITQTNQPLHAFDRVRVGPESRVGIRWSDQSIARFSARTEIEILAPLDQGSQPGIRLFQGILSFFHRDKAGSLRVLTRGAPAGVDGTEFVVRVDPAEPDRAVFYVIDGKITLKNEQGDIVVSTGQEAVARVGERPEVKTAGFVSNNVLQWSFYYPGVLDLAELSFPEKEKERFGDSIAAYRSGDLLRALANYPKDLEKRSEIAKIYHAGLLLSVGQVEHTEEILRGVRLEERPELGRLASALRQLIAAVRRERVASSTEPQLASELLAASYYYQSLATGEASLREALRVAREAVNKAPEFGFGWARVAELEFSFGRRDAALDALEQALSLSPRNAQAMALKGFLLASENKTREAMEWFDQAIAADSSLGNAWLGRGLCRIKKGDLRGGSEDLLVAAALEPQRSILRSYLAKAYGEAGKSGKAEKEVELAKRFDSKDPTGWLYSALLLQQKNEINKAIGDLERSQELNDNRSLFRSQLLLDQDRAVRSANLASLYRDAGMSALSIDEAAKAVTYNYADASAHLFLSDSYNGFRDPTRFNLRVETVWFNELLLANLLAPVGAGRLSQTVSQQEYSRLFEAEGLGLANSTTVRSDGVYKELFTQEGTFGNTSWAMDLDYQHNDGTRVNNELDRTEWYTTIKQQVSAKDLVMLLTKVQEYESGDNYQYLDPGNARKDFLFEENQRPLAVLGYQHEWSPESRTLVLAGRLENEQQFSDKTVRRIALEYNGTNSATVHERELDIDLGTELEIYTGEVQQIWQTDRSTVVAGSLYQSGRIEGTSVLTTDNPSFSTNRYDTRTEGEYERFKGYLYVTLEAAPQFWITGGFSYQWIECPSNFRNPPFNGGEEERSMAGPKAAILWSPSAEITIRGVYSRSLGGVSLEESFRLEPTQLVGFPTAWRTVISESLVGSVSAPEFEAFGVGVDWKLGPSTYVAFRGQKILSEVEETIGAFERRNGSFTMGSSAHRELDYEDLELQVLVSQLIGSGLVAGAQYHYVQAELNEGLRESSDLTEQTAQLHTINCYLLYNHPSGFFGQVDAVYYRQFSIAPEVAEGVERIIERNESLIQMNLSLGYRFFKRRAQIEAGILNLTDADYRLHPLTVYAEIPRTRVFYSKLDFRF
jgi:tetratricopeptide (TPR) repeat protein